MNRIIKHFLQIALFAPVFLPLTACALSGKAIEGQVLEEGTNKPIDGAIVTARWSGNNWSGLVHSQTTCYHVETTVSDEQGRFHIKHWSDPQREKSFFVNERSVIVFAYKPGYVNALPVGDTVYLKPFTGGRGERFAYLVRTYGSGCGATDGSEKNSILLLRAQYQEAQGLVQTPEEKRMLEFLLYGLETTEIGFEEAQKRHLGRVKNK